MEWLINFVPNSCFVPSVSKWQEMVVCMGQQNGTIPSKQALRQRQEIYHDKVLLSYQRLPQQYLSHFSQLFRTLMLTKWKNKHHCPEPPHIFPSGVKPFHNLFASSPTAALRGKFFPHTPFLSAFPKPQTTVPPEAISTTKEISGGYGEQHHSTVITGSVTVTTAMRMSTPNAIMKVFLFIPHIFPLGCSGPIFRSSSFWLSVSPGWDPGVSSTPGLVPYSDGQSRFTTSGVLWGCWPATGLFC